MKYIVPHFCKKVSEERSDTTDRQKERERFCIVFVMIRLDAVILHRIVDKTKAFKLFFRRMYTKIFKLQLTKKMGSY